jgi:L-iditol 2-dehydrogenase
MSGLLHVKLARIKNCSIIATDINPKRLGRAKSFGAEITIDAAADNVAERLLAENSKLADVVILCTSAMIAVEQAWKCVDKSGLIVFFAVPSPDKQVTIPINEFWTREIRICPSYNCGPPDIVESINLIESGSTIVDDMITQQLPLKNIATGFQLVMDGSDSIKVIIKPND